MGLDKALFGPHPAAMSLAEVLHPSPYAVLGFISYFVDVLFIKRGLGNALERRKNIR